MVPHVLLLSTNSWIGCFYFQFFFLMLTTANFTFGVNFLLILHNTCTLLQTFDWGFWLEILPQMFIKIEHFAAYPSPKYCAKKAAK